MATSGLRGLRAVAASWSYPKMPWDFLFVFFLFAVIVPWRGWARMQRLLAMPSMSAKDRMGLYTTSIASQWLLSALVLWRAIARGLQWEALGFNLRPVAAILLVGILGAGSLGFAHWFNLRRIGRSGSPQVQRLRTLASKLFPHSNREAALFACLSVTAGICEEFLYRGFVFAALNRIAVPTWGVLLISSVLFGLAHAYQGRGGILGTLALGTVFGAVRILYDSLVPVILWHTSVDIVAGFAGRRYLIENKTVMVE